MINKAFSVFRNQIYNSSCSRQILKRRLTANRFVFSNNSLLEKHRRYFSTEDRKVNTENNETITKTYEAAKELQDVTSPPNSNTNSNTNTSLKTVFTLDDETKELTKKYKIYEDSVAEAVEKLKEDVPEIKNHVKFRNWVNKIIDEDKQDEVLLKHGIVILKKKENILHRYGIDAHHYFKYQDRDYEVDIHYEQTRDLLEKQRVVDTSLEEFKGEVNKLIGFYENRFKFTKHNNYRFLIYKNNYNHVEIQRVFLRNLFTVIPLSVISLAVNPLLLLLLIPDYCAILKTSFLFNNTIDEIYLNEDKVSFSARRYNFLGFKRDPALANWFTVQNLFYKGIVRNILYNIGDKGLFLFTRIFSRKKHTEKYPKDRFISFHKLLFSNGVLYIPSDLSKQHPDTNEELLLALLNKDTKFLLEYDYSSYETRYKTIQDLYDNFRKELAKKSHDPDYITKEDELKAEYCKYSPNRDYSDMNQHRSLKRLDEIDGYYINNGYR